MKKLIFIVSLTFSLALQAQEEYKQYNVSKGTGADGFDVVGYFDGKVEKGKKEHMVKYQGIAYYFASNERMRRFELNPASYLPQYGGWCAFAMGKNGDKVKVDPKTYKIVEGKLYLFYNKGGYNTLVDWNREEPALKVNADKHWNKLIKE